MALDSSMPVLVVGGDSAETEIVRSLLGQLGIADVDSADDPADALTKLHDKRYRLIISGWQAEPKAIFEFLREVRAEPNFARIPIIMTGESSAAHVIAAKRGGANSYIVKPYNAHTLKAKIEAASATKTVPLPERQHGATAAAAAQSHDAPAAAPTAADRLKFPGVFTTSFE
jgi:two-component system, chemotaxis family, chemotaxis protein CheY